MQRSPLAGAPTLIGRSEELELVTAALGRSLEGEGQLVLIEGEAGIGKTRLLAEVLAQLDGQGARVLQGAAEEMERERPFGAMMDALRLRQPFSSSDPERATIARLLADEPPSTPDPFPLAQGPEIRFRLLEAILSLIERLASQGPVVLAVEDVQWADPASLLVIHRLAKRLSHLPVSFVGTSRPWPRPPELNRILEILRSRRGLHLILEPLDASDVAALVAEMLRGAPGPRLVRQLAQAGGNPFFVTEIVAALRDQQALQVVDGQAEVGDIVLPASLSSTILRRLDFLAEESLDVLAVASVLGTSFSLEDLALVLGRQSSALVAVIREALRGGVLKEVADRLAFRHDLIREAIYHNLPLSVSKGLHLQAGQALATGSAPPLQVANHLALGASPGDQEAVEWLRRAARDATARAPDLSAQLFERALALIDRADPLRDALLAELASVLVWSGRVTEGEKVASEVLDRSHDPTLEQALRVCLRQALFLQGRMHEASQQMLLIVQASQPSARDRAAMVAEICFAHLVAGDLEGARVEAERAKEVGEAAGDDYSVSMALYALAAVSRLRGSWDDALALLERAVTMAEETGNEKAQRRQPRLYLAAILMDFDRLDDAERTLERSRLAGERLGTVWEIPAYHWGLGLQRFLAGRWDDAIIEVQAGLSSAEEFGTRIVASWGYGVLAYIAVHRGDLRAADDALADLDRELSRSGLQFGVEGMLGLRALAEEARGKKEEALSLLESAWQHRTSLGIVPDPRMLGPDLVRLALDTDRRDLARAVTESVEEAASRIEVATVKGAVLRCRGLLEADPEILLRSVDAYRQGPRPFERALATEDAAVALAHRGELARALPLLDESLEVYERVGALHDSARATAFLRARGVHRGSRARRRRAGSGWESLTDTELKVLGLVCEGLANPEIGCRLFISRRTVDTHVSHLLAKLGVSTRTSLVALASRHGLAQ